MNDARHFAALCDALYAAVLDIGRLHEFSAALCAATGSHIGAVMVHDPQVRSGRLDVLTGADPSLIGAYEREMAADNIWLQRGDRFIVTGAVSDSDAILPRGELRRSRYYQEMLRLLDIEQSVALCAHRDEHSITMATINRSGRLRPYGEREMALLRRVAPHWTNSHAIRRRLGGLEQRVQALEQALDALPTAMLLLDARQQARRMNLAADALFRGGWLLRGCHGLAARGCDARAWERMLARACRGEAADGRLQRAQGGMLLCHGGSGQPALAAAVHPLPLASPLGPASEEVAVLFVQPVAARGSRPLRLSLAALFGFTGAEAALAMALLAQPDLEAAAPGCGISIGTARTRLKVLFDKTGEHSQAGLVRLLTVVASVTEAPGAEDGLP